MERALIAVVAVSWVAAAAGLIICVLDPALAIGTTLLVGGLTSHVLAALALITSWKSTHRSG